VDGEAQEGPIAEPDVVIEGDPQGVYYFLVERRLDLVSVEGDSGLLEQLLDVVPVPVAVPATA
jgi:hypothetical protein